LQSLCFTLKRLGRHLLSSKLHWLQQGSRWVLLATLHSHWRWLSHAADFDLVFALSGCGVASQGFGFAVDGGLVLLAVDQVRSAFGK